MHLYKSRALSDITPGLSIVVPIGLSVVQDFSAKFTTGDSDDRWGAVHGLLSSMEMAKFTALASTPPRT